MTRLVKINMLLLAVVLIISSCKKEDGDIDENNANKVEFADAPASTLTTGSIDVITENTVRYHLFNAAGGAYNVTMVEGKTGLVIIDLGPQFLTTLGDELKAYADAIAKPVSVLITHAHMDHFGNIANFKDVEYYAESTVADILMNDANFSSVISKVNKVDVSQKIQDFTYNFDKVSAAETGENGFVFIEETKALFAGDLIYNKAHNYIREYTPQDSNDELTNWMNGLNQLKTKFGNYSYVFVGHGGLRTDVSTVIEENIDYLNSAQNIINGNQKLSTGDYADSVQKVVDELKILYPNYADGAVNLSLPNAFYDGDPGAAWF